MHSIKGSKLVSGLLVNGVLLLIVLMWTLPTIGLLVSSLRLRNDIQASGWWTVLPHRGWVEGETLPIPEGHARDDLITIEGVTATFDEFRAGVETPDGRLLTWVGNLRSGRIEVQERGLVTNLNFTLDNYRQVLAGRQTEITNADGTTTVVQGDNFTGSFLNSLTVAVPATVIPILIAAFAAYGFAWMRFPGRRVMFIMVVGLLVAVMGWFILSGLLNLQIDVAEEAARLHRTTRAAADRQAQILADVVERLDGLAHWTALSESTRGLLVRRREQEVFAKQIETAIEEGDWPEAVRLIDLFAEHFDDPALTARLRERIDSARGAADERVVRTRIAEVRSLIDGLNFPAAELVLNRLAGEFPTDRRLDDLRSTFVRARRRHGEAMQDRFHRLLGERRLEEALGLLDELGWLDGEALAALREQWKETFRQSQHEARDDFTAAVKAKQWARAGEIGELILTRYPDSSLAADVRKLIEGLRQRARSEPAGQGAPMPVEDRPDEPGGAARAEPAPEPPQARPVAPQPGAAGPQQS